jgi:acetylornithine/N-succinyldiaminopimelate aminotransferase
MLSERQLFLNHLAQTSSAPLLLEFTRAEGIYLFDRNDKKYIDLISGISVSNIGHGNAKVREAIHKQTDLYLHQMVFGEYVQSPQVQFAARLISLLPAKLNSIYFTNSGTEAAEGAMKLAKRFTNRTEIISFQNAYHGSSQGALSLMGNENFKNAFRPLLPDVKTLRFNSEEDVNQITERTAAVFIELIQGEAGVQIANEIFLQKLKSRCEETKTLLVFDECQTGMGRTGKLFAFEHYKIIPDILLSAKALGGGLPLGAFISSKEIMRSLSYDPVLGHITTFGGHPLSCAAGLAALNELIENSFISLIKEKENIFLQKLKHSEIKSIRSKGLLIAIELENFEKNKRIIDNCIENRVIVDWFLFAENCLRIAPPLIISNEQIEEACSIIIRSIESVD